MTFGARYMSLIVAALLGCAAPDRSITRGADGAQDWQRHLSSAVPLGMSEDAVFALMQRNGFRCNSQTDNGPSIHCDKMSNSQPVHRRWQAIVNLDRNHRVAAVRGSTGLIGP
jgi:hypothetical protein